MVLLISSIQLKNFISSDLHEWGCVMFSINDIIHKLLSGFRSDTEGEQASERERKFTLDTSGVGAIFQQDADEKGSDYIRSLFGYDSPPEDVIRSLAQDELESDGNVDGNEESKRIAEENEKDLDETLKTKPFVSIVEEVTPKALTSCKTNALFKAFEVNNKLKDLAERRGPEQEEVDKLANSVSEFASAMINPLKSDAEMRGNFQHRLDEVLHKAINLKQKKFISHPVVDALLQEMWYGSFFDLSKSPWTESGYWRLILLHIWALIDAFMFPFFFALLFTMHLLLKRCSREKRGALVKESAEAGDGDENGHGIPLGELAVAVDGARDRHDHGTTSEAVEGEGNNHGVKRKDLYERYRDYFTTPCFIFVRDTLSYLTLLILHFVICLSPSTVALSSLEWVVLVFFLGRIVMEVQQFIDPKKAGKKENRHKSIQGNSYEGCSSDEQSEAEEVLLRNFKNYFSDQWNKLDVIILAIYTATFTLRVISWTVSVSVANNRLLAVAYYFYGFIAMLLTLRAFGHVMEGVRGMGAVLIALFFIVRDVSAIFWQFIAAIVAFSIAITNIYVVERSYVSTRNATEELVCSTDHGGFHCWWSVTKHLAWSLLGLADLDSLNSVDGPSVTLVHFLYSLFLILGVILLVNMMIALLSNTYTRVEENSLKEWSFKKAVTIKTYRTYHPVPVPFNLVSVPALCLYRKFKRCACKKETGAKTKEEKKHMSLEEVVEKLEAKYFATYGYEFPLTDQRTMDQLLYETNGNRRMANQISRRVFKEPGFKQRMFEAGANAWKSMGIEIEGCLLTCIGVKKCTICGGDDCQERYGAQYKKPFTKEMPRMEVLIQEGGEMRIVGVGAVFDDYQCHWMPGWRNGSAGYHADHGTIFDQEDHKKGRDGEDAMAHRGDLMACEVDFDNETHDSIPVKFFLNGRKVGNVTVEYTPEWKILFPYIGMGKGIRVIAKMCPRNESPAEEVNVLDKAKQEIKGIIQEKFKTIEDKLQAMEVERKKEMEELKRLIKTMDVKEK